MNVRYYIDPETDEPHIHNHGIEEQEVEDVVVSPGEDRPACDGARMALGRTRAGRYLRVVYVPDSDSGSIFVITAYDLTGKPLMAYRRRMRRRIG